MTRTPGPRIVGLETEYGIVTSHRHQVAADEPAPLTPERAAYLLFRHRPAGYRNENLFLINGGRLYLDIGAHPEYATAECSTVAEVVGHDRAGEEILRAMMRRTEATLAARGMDAGLHLLKNNSDSAGNTYGCHENYSVSRRVASSDLLPGFISFLVTRQILVGSGCLQRSEEGNTVFGFSPRAEHLVAETSADPTKERALINTKDEPHADAERFRRLHVISGDTNVCSATTALKVGLTMVVLDMVDAGVALAGLALRDPIACLHQVNADPTGGAVLELADGRRLSAIELQEEFLNRMLTHLDRTGPSPALGDLQEYLLSLAQRGLTALRSGDLSTVDTELDWAIKRKLCEGVTSRRECSLADPALARVELAYHDLSDDFGLAPRLRDAGLMAEVVPDAWVQHLRNHAPSTTRAALRGEFVEAAIARGADFAVSWDRIRLDSPPTPEVDLPDPFATRSSAAEALIVKVREMAEHEAVWIDEPGKGGLGAPG